MGVQTGLGECVGVWFGLVCAVVRRTAAVFWFCRCLFWVFFGRGGVLGGVLRGGCLSGFLVVGFCLVFSDVLGLVWVGLSCCFCSCCERC